LKAGIYFSKTRLKEGTIVFKHIAEGTIQELLLDEDFTDEVDHMFDDGEDEIEEEEDEIEEEEDEEADEEN
jgi:hypothetical protein